MAFFAAYTTCSYSEIPGSKERRNGITAVL
jgi:hypothetical protein